MSYVKQMLGVLRVNKSRIKNFHGGKKKKKRKCCLATGYCMGSSMCVWSRLLLVQSPPKGIL